MIIKKGEELTNDEIEQINASTIKEFKIPFELNDEIRKRLYFLLKKENEVLSFGALGEVNPVVFENKEYVLYGIYGVISNIKRKGYGKEVVTSIRDYLVSNDLTGIGFCMPNNAPFYEKYGFKIVENATQRFVYIKNDERITNQDGQYIFFQDSTDNFMKKVLEKPTEEVFLPTDNLW